jgi:hypothetical protein
VDVGGGLMNELSSLDFGSLVIKRYVRVAGNKGRRLSRAINRGIESCGLSMVVDQGYVCQLKTCKLMQSFKRCRVGGNPESISN